jgi:NMD protein affecting ribosome stability and mRNA decay
MLPSSRNSPSGIRRLSIVFLGKLDVKVFTPQDCCEKQTGIDVFFRKKHAEKRLKIHIHEKVIINHMVKYQLANKDRRQAGGCILN